MVKLLRKLFFSFLKTQVVLKIEETRRTDRGNRHYFLRNARISQEGQS